MAALDLDREALAAERERAAGVLPVEFVDKAAWLAMQRLAATGLLQFTHEARTLHRSAALPAESVDAELGDGKAVEAMAAAERLLRMAKVLVAGGFPEEAPALLAKSLRSVTAALTAKRGEALADPGADGDIRRLVERNELPAEALAILEATNPKALAPDASGVQSLIAATTRILATIKVNEPSLSARQIARP